MRRRMRRARPGSPGSAKAVNAGEIGFLEGCGRAGVRLAVDRVLYFSHWITPEPAPKRYDTRFFVAALPLGQSPIHDDYETIDTVWVQPAAALARAEAGEFDLIFPTIKNLQAIGGFATSAELLAAAAAVDKVPAVLPKVVADGRGVRILLPWDEGYDRAVGIAAFGGRDLTAAEVGDAVRTIGADGRGAAAPGAGGGGGPGMSPPPLDVEPDRPAEAGTPVAIAPGVVRLTAPNAGMMTGPGTNSYLVGDDDLAVVDPGPDDGGHLDRLAEAGAGRIRTIVVTHTHPDHAPGAAGLAARTGAEVIGFAERDGFVPDTTAATALWSGTPGSGRCTPPATPPTISAGCSRRRDCSFRATTSWRARRS